jgi:hypothetical protein
MASPTSPEVRHRNLGTAKQALAAAGIKDPATLRAWVRRGLIHAIRVGNGPYRYDLDEVAAMVVTYPRDDVDERIRELVENAPEFSAEQVNKIRLLLHATPAP